MSNTTKKITAIGALIALIVVLQLFSNFISFGPVSINLALIPIIVGALLYGPWIGLGLGVVDGLIILLAPSTGAFMAINPLVTVVLCLLKTGLGGLFAGFMPKIFKKHDKVGVVLASLFVPIINTGLFALTAIIVFMELFESVTYLFVSAIGINFLIEFGVVALLSPTIYYIVQIIKKRQEGERK